MRIMPEDARRMCESLLRALEVPEEDAALLTDIHLDAELRGEQSHGLRCLLLHFGRIAAGTMRRKLKVTVLMDRGAVGLFDAHHSIGQVVGTRAMRLAIAKAKAFGVGLVGIRNNNSITSLKYYASMAVQEGMIGIVYTNTRPMIPPHGGMTATVGNNPLAIAAPAGAEFPFVLDMACATAKEKIFQAAAEHRAIPPDWALGRDGAPTIDPKEALETGVLLPFGGYKAFGLALAHEVLTSALCGGDLFTGEGTGFRPFENLYYASQYFQAVNIEWFVPLQQFRAQIDAMIGKVKASALRPGVERVYVPGEIEFLELETRMRAGFPMAADVWDAYQQWARRLGIELTVQLNQ